MVYRGQLIAKDDVMQDEIDLLFQNLEQVDAPPALIARILAQTQEITPVSLPAEPQLPRLEPRKLEDWLESHQKRKMC